MDIQSNFKVESKSFYPKPIISFVPRAVPEGAATLSISVQNIIKPTCQEECEIKVGGSYYWILDSTTLRHRTLLSMIHFQSLVNKSEASRNK